jgi:hypothetical protein
MLKKYKVFFLAFNPISLPYLAHFTSNRTTIPISSAKSLAEMSTGLFGGVWIPLSLPQLF